MGDRTYADASVEAVAKTIADYFRILVENGLTREEALAITRTWVASLAKQVGLDKPS